ncbi:hypothetical protein HQ590_08975 [bacterium]|nr:hypothetical protein [bacterium]
MIWTLALAFMGSTATADAELSAWVHDVVCPMVGPMNQTSGPTGKSADQILEDFRPEIAEWSILPAQKLNPLCPKGILGGLEYQEFPQSPRHDYQLWLDKFGTKWEPTEDCGVAVPAAGRIAGWKYGTDQTFELWYMCHNAPRWHAFHRDSIVRAAKNPDCALIRQDNIAGPSGVYWNNGGWCQWCLAGFKERLQKRFTADEAKKLGIPSPDTLAMAPFLHARLGAKPDAAIEDPVLREYTRFLLKSNLDLWRDEVSAAHAIRPDLPVCGNQGNGIVMPYPTVLLSDVSDLIFLENSRRQYPRNGNSIYYALALAGGRHTKPAWIWDFGKPEYMEQVDGSRLFVAECYANGATPYYEMNNLAHSPVKGYYQIPMGGKTYDALRGYAAFARRYRDLLTRGYAADAPVAILYSVPSFLPQFCGALDLGPSNPWGTTQANHFLGFARILEREHLPYNVEVLGDETFWPDGDLDRRLARYRLLLCPNVAALSDQQAAALRRFVQEGGCLVSSGELGTRDETYGRRARPVLTGLAEHPGRGRVSSLGDEPVRSYTVSSVRTSRGASQVVMLNQSEPKPLVIRGWSKCQDVSVPADNDYGIWLDLRYQDGTPLYAQVAPFRVGTHGWEKSEYVIHPAKPLEQATVIAIFRYHSGTACFDDLFLGEVGSDHNLLENPGFEGGDGNQIPGWRPFGATEPGQAYRADAGAARSGKQGLCCEVAPPTGDDPDSVRVARACREALTGTGQVLETTAPPTVFIRPIRHGDRLVVHLLNLDYDDGQDKVRPVGPFRLVVPLPAGTTKVDGEVELLTPDEPQTGKPITHRVKDGCLTLQVPSLKIWSLLSFRAR